MFDTHNHLLEKRFQKDIDQVLERISDAGMRSLTCATNYQESLEVIEFLKGKENLFGSVGLDPQDVGKEEFDEAGFRKILEQKNPQIVAIGEVGLDYYWPENLEHKELQKKVFKKQLEMAKEFNLPVIIHCRDQEGDTHGAFNDLFEILVEVDSPATGVVHSFTGSEQQAQKIVELGYYLGFNGIITFKNAGHLIDVVKSIPQDRILIETDAPYLAPVPKRGERNEPVFVEYVGQKIADLLQMSKEEFMKISDGNAEKLFQIK